MSCSDSDDTDILLLIPPNFFSTKVDTDVESRQRNSTPGILNSHVVKGIINHINDLEDRVFTIETIDSARTSCYSDSEMNNRCSGNYKSHLNSPLPGGSLTRTPTKYGKNSTCHSTPSHVPSSRKLHSRENLSKSFSPQRSVNLNENKKYSQGKLLTDIDDFYNLNKANNKHNDSDNLGTSIEMDISNTVEGTLSNLSTSPLKENIFSSKETLDLPAIEKILKQVDATQKEFEEKLKQKEGDFNLNAKRTYSCGSNIQSIPDLNFGLRNFQYDNAQQSDNPEESVLKKHVTPLEEARESKAKRKLDLRDVDLSYAEEMPTGIQELCRSNCPSQEVAHHATNIPAKLLSLSELWKQDRNGESPSKSSNNTVLRRKIEEEKYRREHCEQLIQQLQFRLLEEQEKVAVAVRVDGEKDRAIRALQGGWAQLVTHWREIEEQRHELTNQLLTEKQERQNEVHELNKKLERYEREVSQVVNLAAGYKEKAERAEADRSEVQSEAQTAVESMRESLALMDQTLAETRQKLDDYQRDRKLLADKLTLTEDELDKEKLLTKEVKDQLEELKITLKISKDKIENLEKSLDAESKRSRKLEEELQDARATCEEVLRKEQKAQEDLASLVAQSDSMRSELRSVYQNQLNLTVKEKLREFQAQLDASELTLHRTFQQKEKTIVENAAKQLKNISEKLLLDFKSKCDVYEAETKRLKAELAQREGKLRETQQLLREEGRKRELMAKKVESVMQNQLQQAIHMITSDVTNLRMSKESLASKRHSSEQSLIDSTTTEAAPEPASSRAQPYPAFSADSTHMNLVEKDVSAGAGDMRKYIEMLLEKPPGNPVSDFEAEPKRSGGEGTSFLESSVTSDIFNEVSYPAAVSKTARSKSNEQTGSQTKQNCKKIWK